MASVWDCLPRPRIKGCWCARCAGSKRSWNALGHPVRSAVASRVSSAPVTTTTEMGTSARRSGGGGCEPPPYPAPWHLRLRRARRPGACDEPARQYGSGVSCCRQRRTAEFNDRATVGGPDRRRPPTWQVYRDDAARTRAAERMDRKRLRMRATAGHVGAHRKISIKKKRNRRNLLAIGVPSIGFLHYVLRYYWRLSWGASWLFIQWLAVHLG